MKKATQYPYSGRPSLKFHPGDKVAMVRGHRFWRGVVEYPAMTSTTNLVRVTMIKNSRGETPKSPHNNPICIKPSGLKVVSRAGDDAMSDTRNYLEQIAWSQPDS